ncbi:hypothetical protein [Halorarius litoreus]|uniref:hypothetical protein n=1 Tax=Halorarius litoreus TaxID=2962676 RepID=UPI0020CDC0D5|nr:hypothetical protein [Halorarius litoreus]
MPRRPLVTALLILVAVGLLANPVWFFPAEGETRYTYTRVPVEVQENRLAYDPPDSSNFSVISLNDLEGIGCDYTDHHTLPRGCEYDTYLVENGPVGTSYGEYRVSGPQFVYLNGSYYKRLKYDVERVSPHRVRAELAENASALPSDPEYESFAVNLVRHGGTRRSTMPPQDHVLGRIYKVHDGYYAVALVEAAPLDRPFVSPLIRLLLGAVGVGLLIWARYRVMNERENRVGTS